jgi:hypothetical protein
MVVLGTVRPGDDAVPLGQSDTEPVAAVIGRHHAGIGPASLQTGVAGEPGLQHLGGIQDREAARRAARTGDAEMEVVEKRRIARVDAKLEPDIRRILRRDHVDTAVGDGGADREHA